MRDEQALENFMNNWGQGLGNERTVLLAGADIHG
jgi:hypothetical protein